MMARGKRWTREENNLLIEMAKQRLMPQQIYDSGKLPGRTVRAIQKQLRNLSIVYARRKTIVRAIGSAPNALSIEDVLRRFSTAFKQICELKEVDRWELQRFRIIFSAAKDYGPLLAHYERLKSVEGEIADLRKMVEEVKAQVSARNPETQA